MPTLKYSHKKPQKHELSSIYFIFWEYSVFCPSYIVIYVSMFITYSYSDVLYVFNI